MSKLWQNSLSKAEKIALSQRIAGATGMDERAVEKDWWVVVVLKALSMTQYAHEKPADVAASIRPGAFDGYRVWSRSHLKQRTVQ